MGNSLKDALLKAGLKPSKTQNERPRSERSEGHPAPARPSKPQNSGPDKRAEDRGSMGARPPHNGQRQDYRNDQRNDQRNGQRNDHYRNDHNNGPRNGQGHSSGRYNDGPARVIPTAPPVKAHSHQQTRTYCDVCERTLPDVEYYRHRNPTVDANWICIGCADKNEIPDNTRTTAQSEMASKGMFRRFYGPTNHALRPGR